MKTIDENGQHDFFEKPGTPDGACFVEGFWDARLVNPKYLAKKQADKISYGWDHLIEHYAAGKFTTADGTDARAEERALRLITNG